MLTKGIIEFEKYPSRSLEYLMNELKKEKELSQDLKERLSDQSNMAFESEKHLHRLEIENKALREENAKFRTEMLNMMED